MTWDRRVGGDRRGGQVGLGLRAFLAGLLFGLLLGVSLAALADPTKAATFRWVDPSMFTDGAPIEPGELQQLDLFRETPEGRILVQTFDPGVGEWSTVLELPPGEHCFHMTATALGEESGPSNQLCGTWSENGGGVGGVFHIPSPPSGFAVDWS